jgi:alkanesulfonate monooxygenase SsuD/methylene tetrahydromethanopterin reductase-like flavin-dependent oxidoreductase (luciferase family)
MKIGIQLPEVERAVRWEEVREIALGAEDLGFDSVWVGDHLLFRDTETGTRGPWEAWSMLAALAEATSTIELGPLVAATAFHAPAMIAKKTATVDEVSGGRLILGLGAGWNKAEFDAFGFPYDHRVSRFEEAFTIIRTLVRESAIEFDGSFYTLEDMELLPPARPDIPLMIGSNGHRMLRIAVPHVQMWNTWYASYGNRPEGLEPLLEGLARACADVGRDPDEIEKTAAVYVQLPRGQGREAGSSERPAVTPILAEALPEALGELEEMGIAHIQVVLDPIDVAGVEELAGIVGIG